MAADDLDLILVRLVHALRARGATEVLRPCEVLEVVQDMIPYRLLRREGEFDGNEDYEHALMRLLSGERGYLRGDEKMQQVLREELAAKNPDTALFREFARNHVAMTTEGIAVADRLASAPLPVAVATVTTPMHPDEPPPRRVSAVTAAFADVDPTLSNLEADMAAAPPRFVTAQAIGGKCRFCAATLPDGRKIVFCPFCGNDLTTMQCPACSTDLELGWKFCTTCGRTMAGRTPEAGATPVDTPAQATT